MQSNWISSLSAGVPVDSFLKAGSVPGAASGSAPFSNLLKNAIDSEQNLENQASSTVEGLMSGSGVDVHQAMIATQKANLAFEMALAVRNKAVAAYQQVMQMQF
ncbi:MAG TPA: flagellar hook-basal body complex protein FliE [Silvibacterium sp.]|jgi:flagellar hook-basal body complex protein FliE|nr:flagellar hook-basal body complex protein FliE [Silvibacterium sp.]